MTNEPKPLAASDAGVSEMVERVAAAMWAVSDSSNPDEEGWPWSECGEAQKAGYRAHARAAIAAMREPTREMLKAASAEEDRCAVQNYGGSPSAEDIWSAMIDAALESQDETETER